MAAQRKHVAPVPTWRREVCQLVEVHFFAIYCILQVPPRVLRVQAQPIVDGFPQILAGSQLAFGRLDRRAA